MRNFLFAACVLALVACGNQNATNDDQKTDNQETVKPPDTLDQVLNIADETELKKVFGEENVTMDTVWGPEGDFSMGIVVYSGTPDEIVIDWDDAEHHKGIIAVAHYAQYDRKAEKHILKSRWVTSAGIRLGTTLTQLVDMNGGDFIFYGLGWDYGGGITDWQKGKLAAYHHNITLGLVDVAPAQAKDYEKIMGEAAYLSSLPAARKLNPCVFNIVVSKN